MAYRQRDEDAVCAQEREEQIRRELAERARVGRLRIAAERAKAKSEERAVAFSIDRFRWRVSKYATPGSGWAPPPRELVAWIFISAIIALGSATTTRDGWSHFVPVFFVVALLGSALVLPFHAAIYWLLGRRDARRAQEWSASLPFPVDGVVELLGRPADIVHVAISVAMREGEELPSDALVTDLLGQVSVGGQATASVVEGVLRIENPHPDDTDQSVYEWLCAVVRDVLEPLHRASPIARVVVSGTCGVPHDE